MNQPKLSLTLQKNNGIKQLEEDPKRITFSKDQFNFNLNDTMSNVDSKSQNESTVVTIVSPLKPTNFNLDLNNLNNLNNDMNPMIPQMNINNNKPMTLIAKKLKVTVGSLTICLNRLVQKGYLLRTRHEMDHRIILVSITQKGKKVLKVHDTFHDNILGLVLEGVTLQQAMKVMTQFALVLENYYDPKSISSLTEKKGSKK